MIARRRSRIHQTLNSIGIIFGVVFTAGSLIASAVSVRAAQRELQNNRNELHNSQQGQITDRYTKAVDQLGSGKIDIRLGGIYALQRLASDSPRDQRTVIEVLCAFVREHDPKPGAEPPAQPDTDIQAALTVIGRLTSHDHRYVPDLRGIRTPGVSLPRAANWDLSGAHLTSAKLFGADLSHAVVIGADLSHANLSHANLSGTILSGADLSGADLTDADVGAATLLGTDLRGVRGITANKIRSEAFTNSSTRF